MTRKFVRFARVLFRPPFRSQSLNLSYTKTNPPFNNKVYFQPQVGIIYALYIFGFQERYKYVENFDTNTGR